MNAGRSERSSVGLVVWLSLHVICSVIVLSLLLKYVPQYEKIFKDFGCKLPEFTSFVINLSRTIGRYWWVLAPLLAAGDIGIMVGLHRTGQSGLLTAWGVLVWLALMLLVGLIVLAIIVPMNDLMMQLSK